MHYNQHTFLWILILQFFPKRKKSLNLITTKYYYTHIRYRYICIIYCSSIIVILCTVLLYILPSLYSYKYSLVTPDRLSQRENPELYTKADTGLLYKDAITLLMNVSREMETCTSSISTCQVHLCNIQLPTTSDYDITAGTNRYNLFQDTGYPSNPATVSSTASCAKGRREGGRERGREGERER